MKTRIKIILLLTIALVAASVETRAQVTIGGDSNYDIDYLTPKQYEIGGITFSGADHFDHRMILLVAGLQVGDVIKVPGDKLATAIDNLWKQGLFEDIKILVTRIQGDKIFLEIALKGRPKLSKFKFTGVKKNDADKLRDEMKIAVGDVVTENLLTTSKNKILSYYIEKGYTNVEVETELIADTASGKDDRVIIVYNVDRGKQVKIDALTISGNESIKTGKLLRKMKKTHDVNYWKRMYFWTSGFWKKSKYLDADFQEDMNSVISYYNNQGYRDARIEWDTVYPVSMDSLNVSEKKKAKQERVRVDMKIFEGHKFFFRNITFTGNTIYSSEELAKHLRIEKGAPYNKSLLETNLNYNPAGTDITSMYMDNGYLFFRVTPVEVAIENDSIDIEIRIVEGKQARIRNVTLEGNTITNDKIVMRELHTRPGDLFSRDALIRSQRELVTLGYFKQESIEPVPMPHEEDGTVDIVYKVEEGSTSQLQLQGGYGSGMIIGQIGVTLNNFSARNIFKKSAWAPLPAGDGQKLSINAVTNGKYYYAFSGSFTEPWLGGRTAQSLTLSIYHNLFSNGFYYDKTSKQYYRLRITGGGISLSKRLKWPDDYFILSHGITYKHYDLLNYTQLGSLFTDGKANDLSYGITISRNSLDSPIYPRSGSEVSVSGYITPPYSAFSKKDYSTMEASEKYKWLEYYKINIRGSWMLNIVGNLVLNTRVRMGWMGYYNKNIGLTPLGRYYVGGDGLSTYMIDGREVIPLRGYENNSISPNDGGAVFTRYTFELRHPIIESSSATIYVLGFMEGGNCWSDFKDFQPFKLYNSAGVGVRLYMPMFGLIGIDWGYGFDGANGGSQFHFSIGQSID
ncbi:MAG: outer membrane protein assembly factor BamA [Bacteroidales bacterium]|nr:outer membrane protein assembly factor BamA [Bacteroidales bacterium]